MLRLGSAARLICHEPQASFPRRQSAWHCATAFAFCGAAWEVPRPIKSVPPQRTVLRALVVQWCEVDESCVICLGSEKGGKIEMTCCGKPLHRKCWTAYVDASLDTRCPYCRHEIRLDAASERLLAKRREQRKQQADAAATEELRVKPCVCNSSTPLNFISNHSSLEYCLANRLP